ncbi:helix-turn-helix domain-containing protein [Wukongibacter baidiensis]|uniref:cupin domain-containing protein n=1 Tax=Wukongibacter baidiensis TaxID=1723361 RepID=UPI003D7F7FE1
MDDINIGKKIMEYRKAKNLSIRELAQLSKVTPSLLSQIERSLANPSINTLKNISKALEVQLFAFFMTSHDSEKLVVRANNRKKIIFPESKGIAYELLSPDLSGSIELAVFQLEKDGESESMEHKGEEVACVIEGKVEILLESERIILNTGDSIKIPAQVRHKWENPYENTCKVIFAITPPSF